MSTILKAANRAAWNAMSILPHWDPLFAHVAGQLVANKNRYASVADKTKVPWWVIAVIHEREASQSWSANLAQGDPWNRKSTHVPRNRGPFGSWDDAAYDALVNCPPHTAKNDDWSAGGTFTALEDYNGDGYEIFHHMASPYNWAGTNQYTKGKYITDGHFDPDAVDHQLGCAGIIRKMMALDSEIAFVGT